MTFALLDAGASFERGGVDMRAVGRSGMTALLERVLPDIVPDRADPGGTGLLSAAMRGYYQAAAMYVEHARSSGGDWGAEMLYAAGTAMRMGYDDVAFLILEEPRCRHPALDPPRRIPPLTSLT